MAGGDREVDATDLPSPKKRPERSFVAVAALVSQLGAIGFETPGADVLKGLRGVCVVRVVTGLLARVLQAIEFHADLIGLHEGPRDTVDVRHGRLRRVLGIASFSGTTTTSAGILVESREDGTSLGGVYLGDLRVSGPDTF